MEIKKSEMHVKQLLQGKTLPALKLESMIKSAIKELQKLHFQNTLMKITWRHVRSVCTFSRKLIVTLLSSTF
jgi:hypothetical protein